MQWYSQKLKEFIINRPVPSRSIERHSSGTSFLLGILGFELPKQMFYHASSPFTLLILETGSHFLPGIKILPISAPK
jgi:hypothetical protein